MKTETRTATMPLVQHEGLAGAMQQTPWGVLRLHVALSRVSLSDALFAMSATATARGDLALGRKLAQLRESYRAPELR